MRRKAVDDLTVGKRKKNIKKMKKIGASYRGTMRENKIKKETKGML